MNHFIEYICRSAVRSEDAICRLNKRTMKLAKCCRQTNTAVLCLGVTCLLTLAVISMQDQEIKALQKQMADITKDDDTVVTNTEEQNQQEGA